MYDCNKCGKQFARKCILKQHLSNKSCNDNIVDDDTNICKYCNKLLSSRYSLNRHLLTCKNTIEQNITDNDNTTDKITIYNNDIQNITNNSSNFYDFLAYSNINDAFKIITDNKLKLSFIAGLHKYIDDFIQHNVNNRFEHNVINKPIIMNNNLVKSQQKPGTTFNDILNANNYMVPNINSSNVSVITSSNTSVINGSNASIAINGKRDNNDNIITNTVDNSSTTNININAPFIYPFGKENLDYFTDADKLEILNNCDSLDGVVIAFDKIYSKMENKNFHKRNMNKNSITIIDENFDLKVHSENEFQKYLLENVICAIKRIFYQSMEKLEFDTQYKVWKNITHMEETITFCTNDSEIIKKLSGMISSNNEDKIIRKIFEDFKSSLLNAQYKASLLKSINMIKVNKDVDDYKTSLKTINPNIKQKYMTDKVWTRNQNDSDDTDLENFYNNINMHYYDTTPRYKFFRDMKECEMAYMKTLTNTLGDINELVKLNKIFADEEIKLQKKTYTPPSHILDDVRKLLIQEPRNNAANVRVNFTTQQAIQN